VVNEHEPVSADATTGPLVAVGETMVSFVSRDGSVDYRAVAAGAESNVAVATARLGLPARWISRLGDDPLGDLIQGVVADAGVVVDAVRDPDRPTGVMVKHVSAAGTRSQYYRAGSAASALGPEDLARVDGAGWVHLTGITPALSTDAANLVRAIIEHRKGRVSFDLNYRAPLWPDAAAASEVLLPLASASEVVFIGDDEAALLLGTTDDDEIATRILQRPEQELVVKRGADGAAVVGSGGRVWVPGLPADVVDLTGAGDAFAAGYLAARHSGWAPGDRLRLGHVLGSRVVGVVEDVLPPLQLTELRDLSREWVGSRWIQAQ
jgi:2-dehydro-3-deoxygluconokinase